MNPPGSRSSSTSTSTSRAARRRRRARPRAHRARPSRRSAPVRPGRRRGPLPTGGQYVVAKLEPAVIRHVAETDRKAGQKAAVQPGHLPHLAGLQGPRRTRTRSVATVKVDAARTTFAAWGEGIVWAVLDSGIDGKHPHFKKYKNLDLRVAAGAPRLHRRRLAADRRVRPRHARGRHPRRLRRSHSRSAPLTGARQVARRARPDDLRRSWRSRDLRHGAQVPRSSASRCSTPTATVRPARSSRRCRRSPASTTTAATSRSTASTSASATRSTPSGSPAGRARCATRSTSSSRPGVVVVVSAGNTGYGWNQDFSGESTTAAGLDVTINDPGNAERAITVGATHRDSPHSTASRSSRRRARPATGDCKPDLVAPGERILGAGRGTPARTRPTGEGRRGLPRGQRHQHGGTARLRGDRRVPVGPQRVHRRSGPGQGDLRRVRRSTSNGSATSRATDWSTCSAPCSPSDRRHRPRMNEHRRRRPMAELSGFPYAEVQFGIDGQVLDSAERKAADRDGRRASPTSWSSRTAGTTTWPRPAGSTRAWRPACAAVLGQRQTRGYGDREARHHRACSGRRSGSPSPT